LNLNKAECLEYGDLSMTHAMVLTGAQVDANGKVLRWKVENAWGTTIGHKGWFVMSDTWFDEYALFFYVVIESSADVFLAGTYTKS
jgi:bleomycin hydrolase